METVIKQMTAAEAAEFEAFQADRREKEAAEKEKQQRETYKELVEDSINKVAPELLKVSHMLKDAKSGVFDIFSKAIALKEDIYGVKSSQQTHTFTSADSTKSITLGYRVVDGWADTVNEGITIVHDALGELGKDDNSKLLVKSILKLLSKDSKGTLKASRVLQLRKIADESRNAKLIKGTTIIEESYQPSPSSQFVTLRVKDNKGNWQNVPLGMTEA